jgi:hypothetical protein
MPAGGAVPARPSDTTEDAERVQVALFRAAPVARRLQVALALSAATIGLARRSLGRARPGLSPREVDLLFVEWHYGRDVADGLRTDLGRRHYRARS